MINTIKDFLGLKREFKVDLYGIGYMGNIFYIETVSLSLSKRFYDVKNLTRDACKHRSYKLVTNTFPLLACVCDELRLTKGNWYE